MTTPTPPSAAAQATATTTPQTDDAISVLLALLGEFSRGNIFAEDLIAGMKLALAPIRSLERENADLVAALEESSSIVLAQNGNRWADINEMLAKHEALIVTHKKGAGL